MGIRALGMTSAVRARMPPSPWLSARITSIRYLIEMMMISDQNTSEATPNALTGFSASRWWCSNALAERVQRAGADVAVDDAERAERQRAHAGAVSVAIVTVGRVMIVWVRFPSAPSSTWCRRVGVVGGDRPTASRASATARSVRLDSGIHVVELGHGDVWSCVSSVAEPEAPRRRSPSGS